MSITKLCKLSFLAALLALVHGNLANASPSVTVGAVGLTTTSAFNGYRAVCGTDTSLAVDVSVSATFDTAGTCLNLGGGTKLTATGSGSLAATVSLDGGPPVPLTCIGTGPFSCSGSVAVGTEGGPHTVTVSGTATDANAGVSCTGGSTSPTGNDSGSEKYVTDQQGPTVTIQAYSPGPVPPSTIPQILAGEAITVHTKIDDGSSGTPFSITLSASGPSSLGPSTTDDTFNGPSGPNDNGKASPANNDVALQTSCNTPVGIYTMKADVDTQDLCGNDFATITKDPAGTHDGASGNDTTGQFEVLPAISLEDVTHVISEFPGGDYGIDQCFTSQSAGAKKSKVVNNPGTVHLAAIVNATVPGTCESSTISNPVVKLTLDPAFSFLKTGKSPDAHVFVGVSAPGFDLHTPVPPFTEVTGAVTFLFSVDGKMLTVDLSNVDVGSGPGVIPTDQTIYVRAHANYSNTSPSPSDATYTFKTSASANGGTLSASDDETIIGNPTLGGSAAICVDGTLE